jgi:hypothetical protein
MALRRGAMSAGACPVRKQDGSAQAENSLTLFGVILATRRTMCAGSGGGASPLLHVYGCFRAGDCHQLGSGSGGGFAEEGFDVFLDGAGGEMQPCGDLFVGAALGHEPQYVGLPAGDA